MHHLLEVTCALKFHIYVCSQTILEWSDDVLTAYHLINFIASIVLGGQIPFTVLSPNAPLFHLPPKIFGCLCCVHILGPGSDKLDPRSIKCVFLGYSPTQKGYRCYSPTLYHCFSSADLTFDESHSYFSPLVSSDSFPPCLPLLPPMSPFESPQKPLQVYCCRQNPPTETFSSPNVSPPDLASLPIALRKGKCSYTSHPISQFVSYDHLSSSLHTFTTSLNSTVVPKYIQEAMSISSWKSTMEAEMFALFENATWS